LRKPVLCEKQVRYPNRTTAVDGLPSHAEPRDVTRFVLYGGKGGVGKTTCAAATGIALAEAGHETLVLSTDPAHSLADAFQVDLSGQPRRIDDHLQLAEIDPGDREEAYRSMAATFAAELREVGIRLTDGDAEDILLSGMATGGEEIAALDALAEYADGDRREYVVLDTAPTGHTLRLLDLPATLETAMETTLKLRGQVRSLADSARQMVLGPYYYAVGRNAGAGDERDEFVAFRERMERVGDLLRDPERTEFRVVTRPETMAIRETERLVARLRESDVPVRTLVVNGVLTSEASEGSKHERSECFGVLVSEANEGSGRDRRERPGVLEEIDERCARCRARRDAHRDRVAEIRRSFPELAVLTLPELDTEVEGPGDLDPIVARLNSALRR
jgi:arsenite-transporting ATPase